MPESWDCAEEALTLIADMTVDRRIRVDGELAGTGPAELFTVTLPHLFAEAQDRLSPSLQELRPRPLTIDVNGQCWSLDVDDDRVTVSKGPTAGTVLRVDAEQIAALVADKVTPMGWLTTGSLDMDGHLSDVLNWWLLLRASLDGTTPHRTGAIEFKDRHGGQLNLGRSFTPDDPADEMAWFLEQAGFLHVKGLYSEEEMAAVSSEMDLVAPRYSDGDGRSWWASLKDGSRALVRMQRFDKESRVAADLVTDERLTRIAALTGDGHVASGWDGNRLEALFKPIGVTQGISDIPWHKDCSLGRHSYDCCGLTVGISVTGADAMSGQLRVVAGSQRALVWPAPSLQPGLDLPIVDLATETGDVTVHCSCTLHMAQPPVKHERRVMYTSFSLPTIGGADADRKELRRMADAAPLNTSQ
ncbi:phytanoyl-CoA dioxygenase family protein [Mycobacterium sp. B14F4]|uniref:phytanoyl-CoA dioxygenase family protein n=1 Tax=Mycobacterium sp. B14F4 TaxID=3153565 RepID=UPI00325DA88E